ncbi:MAG: rRNA maturation RNase YbeY [Steroidobacteraceae bacterium]
MADTRTAKKSGKRVATPAIRKAKAADHTARNVAGRQLLKKTAVKTLQLDVQSGVGRRGVPATRYLQLWAQATYEVHHAAHSHGRRRRVQPVQVSLRIVGTAESRKLNRDWRDEDHATNVLSFPAGEMPEVAGELPSLGDLVICVPVVVREAKAQGRSLQAHWAHLMIHGVLHLLGYDHEVERDAQVMEACEVAILESFGFVNPYT